MSSVQSQLDRRLLLLLPDALSSDKHADASGFRKKRSRVAGNESLSTKTNGIILTAASENF